MAFVEVQYEDGRKSTFGMDAKDDIVERAKTHYHYLVESERKMIEAIRYAKKFEGKDLEW